MKQLQDIEAVLYFDPKQVNEVYDPRNVGKNKSYSAAPTGPGGRFDWKDWKVWNSTSFGNRLQGMLGNLGRGYAAEVSDMGQFVAVRVSYHHPPTGKGVSKTYIIVFEHPDKGDGRVFASSNKWRTISGLDQAVSYISSSIRSYGAQAANA